MDTNRIPKQTLQYRPKDEETLDDRRRDGETNFILRIKEQEIRLTFHEHDDDDDENTTHVDYHPYMFLHLRAILRESTDTRLTGNNRKICE